jgi:hypothetical protein
VAFDRISALFQIASRRRFGGTSTIVPLEINRLDLGGVTGFDRFGVDLAVLGRLAAGQI